MRLAQDGAFSPPLRPLPSSSRKQRTILRGGLDQKRSHLPLQKKLSYLTRLSFRRLLYQSKSIKTQYLASQIDAIWFSSLPQKIQQRQFTREEQVFLAGNRDVVILDASDEALYRLGRQPHTSLRSLRTDAAFQDQHRNHSTNAEPVDDSAVDMDDSFYDSFRWLDEEDDLDLTLDDYHNAITEASHNAPTSDRRVPSLRRALSLTSLRTRRNSLSTKRPLSSHSTIAPLGSGLGARPLSSVPAPLQQPQSSVSSIEPSAQYYQDPEARLKLRVYLASPQKFDEAIEFGFPSLESMKSAQPPVPTAGSRKTEETEHSFLDDAASSSPQEEEDDRDDDMSLTDIDSPRTPQDTIFHPSRPSKKNSLDRNGPWRPHILRTSPEPFTQGPPCGREMTLHMTLTRPDLRTETNLTHMPPQSNDPLTLGHPPLSNERHPVRDSVSEDRSKMRKLWKKLISR